MNHIEERGIELPCEPITKASVSLYHLAQWLAGETSDVQSAFFNEFDIQLRRLCDINKGSLGVSMQCHWINKELTRDAKYTLIDLGTDHDDT